MPQSKMSKKQNKILEKMIIKLSNLILNILRKIHF